MQRQSFTAWQVPKDVQSVLFLEDFAVTGGRFTSTERHFHDELEVHFIERGKVSFLLPAGRLLATPGALLFIPPKRDHVVIETSTDCRRWVLLCRARVVRSVLPKAEHTALLGRSARERHGVLRARDALSLRQTLRDVHAERYDAPPLRNAALAFVLARTFQLFRHADDSPTLGALSPAVARAVELLRSGERPSLPELARAATRSEAHLSKLFSSELGTSITEFRNRIAIERFVEVYGDGSRVSLLDAALEAGFGSYPQFHRVFKKHFGCRPADYSERGRGRGPTTEAKRKTP